MARGKKHTAEQGIFVFALCQQVTLRAAWLVHQPARPALTHAMSLRMARRTAPSLRA